MKYKPLILAALLFSQLPFAWAGTCDNLRSQLQENACAYERFEKAEKQLNGLYNVYKKRLSPEQLKQLKQAQLAWLKFREATCIFESSGVEGGSAHAMVYADCLEAVTLDRIKSLKAWSACTEEDLSCPAPP